MGECCTHCSECDRKKVRDEKEYKDLIHRLSRIEGQVRGIREMVESDRYCVDILTQVSAIQSALNSFNKVLLSTLISTVIAVLFGAVSGCAPAWLDALLMRLTEIFLSVPNLLLVIFLLAAAGKSNVITISAVIGMTSWTSIAKVVRTEVRQIRNSEYALRPCTFP